MVSEPHVCLLQRHVLYVSALTMSLHSIVTSVGEILCWYYKEGDHIVIQRVTKVLHPIMRIVLYTGENRSEIRCDLDVSKGKEM